MVYILGCIFWWIQALLYSYGLCGYGTYSYGTYSYGLYSYGTIVMVYILGSTFWWIEALQKTNSLHTSKHGTGRAR